MADNLDSLSVRLFTAVVARISEDKHTLLRSKWDQVCDVAAQNGGYKSWGDHLLKLGEKEQRGLEEVFKNTVHSIEAEELKVTDFIDSELHFLFDPEAKIKVFPIDKTATKAIFVEYNPQFVAEYRKHFQRIFEVLGSLESWHRRDPFVAQMLVGNLIAFLPLLDFEEKSTLSLLRLIDGQWESVPYRLVYIPLVDGKINAYGLEPMIPKANPILVFQSTPYPAASGFLEAFLSDIHPTKSVGEEIFESGREALSKWLEDKKRVECYGMSLGGALAYHAGHAFGDKLEVHAYVAPGIKRSMSQIRGRGFFHHNDLINLVDLHPESKHFEMFSTLTATDVNFVQAHTMPSGIEPTIVLKINPRYENRTISRFLFTALKAVVFTPLWIPLSLIRWCLKRR